MSTRKSRTKKKRWSSAEETWRYESTLRRWAAQPDTDPRRLQRSKRLSYEMAQTAQEARGTQ